MDLHGDVDRGRYAAAGSPVEVKRRGDGDESRGDGDEHLVLAPEEGARATEDSREKGEPLYVFI